MIGRIIKLIKSRIRYRFLFSYLAVVIPIIAIIGSVIYFYVPKILEKNYSQYMKELNGQIITNMKNEMARLEFTSLMLNFATDLKMVISVDDDTGNINLEEFETSYKYIDNYFFNFIYSFQHIHGAYIYSLNGQNIYTRNKNQAYHFNQKVSEEEWFIESVAKSGQKVIRGRHINTYVNDKTEVISFSRAIVDYSTDKLLGVVAIDQDIKMLGELISGLDIREQSTIIVLDEDNNLVFANDEEFYADMVSKEAFNELGSSNGSYILGEKEEKTYFTQNSITNINWKVINCQRYDVLMKDLILLKKILFITLLLSLISMVIVSNYAAGRMSSKLTKMKALVEKVEGGALDLNINIPGDDEISSLAESFNSMIERINTLIEDEYKETILRKQAELNLLQAQVNPHFLYNTLGSIKSLAKDEGAHKASLMLQNLSSMLRYNLRSGETIVKIKDELDNLKNYLSLQQYRFEDKIQVVYKVPEKILEENIIAMTLQPIVENAIIHGFELKEDKGTLEIRGNYSGEYLEIKIRDDGLGIDKEKEKELNLYLRDSSQAAGYGSNGKSGMFNVNARIKNKFGNQYGVSIKKNSKTGVTVVIKLPRVTHI